MSTTRSDRGAPRLNTIWGAWLLRMGRVDGLPVPEDSKRHSQSSQHFLNPRTYRMEQYEGHLLLGTAEKQETDRVRERNRVAKRASRARQKQLENADSAPRKSKSSRGAAKSEADQKKPTVATTVDEIFPQTCETSAPMSTMSEDTNVFSSPSDEDWVQYFSAALPEQGAASSWDQWSGHNDHAMGSSNSSQQQQLISSSMTGHSSSHAGSLLSYYTSENSSIVASMDSDADLLFQTSDGDINNSSILLHVAVRNGARGIVSSLIDAGADVNWIDATGSSPVHIAVETRQPGVLELLVNNGANINARNSAYMTPLELAVRAHDEQTVNYLLSSGAELY
ncbi:hypothetical protein E8E14_000826 [Neopestalotiopsis sp. 37M]|nr:hypothetical protein E8E14_000826 [Neopestalotiopsis sp. 37M]